VHGIGTIALWLWADDNTMQHITLPHCLYVLACPVGLLCPWHLAAHTGHMTDGFNALADHGILMCNSSKIHVNYDDSTGLPIVSTFGELNHFVQYCASLCSAYNTLTSSPPSPVVQFKQNLSPQKRTNWSCMSVAITCIWGLSMNWFQGVSSGLILP